MNFAESLLQIFDQGLERAFCRRLATDQNIVMACLAIKGEDGADNLAQAALHTIANHGVAQLLRGGEADAKTVRSVRCWRALQDETGRCPFAAAREAQEIGAFDQTRHFDLLGGRAGEGHARAALGRQTLAAVGAAAGENLLAVEGRGARTKAVAALSDDL